MTRVCAPSRAEAHGRDEYDHLAPLLVEYAALLPGSPRRAELRAELVTGFLPVVHHIARRYAGRGEPVADLVQVGTIGLINAVDRFDPRFGTNLLGYAIPTITGEIRRHFRDRAWSMRVPRRVKDLAFGFDRAVGELSQVLARAPRPSEVAAHLGVDVDDVREYLRVQQSTRVLVPLDEPVRGAGHLTLSEMLAEEMADDVERVEHRDLLWRHLNRLPEQDRTVVMLRFFGNMTQTEIARHVGVSQMQVSRLLTRILGELHQRLTVDAALAVAADNT